MKRILLLSLIAFFGLTSGNTNAQTVKLIVTSTSDDTNARDANPGDGICEDNNGRCTLRAAVDEANASSGKDVIIVIPGLLPGSNSGKFTLSRVAPNVAFNTYEDDNAYGDLDINGDFNTLTLQGTGTPGPSISVSPNDRILDIVSGGIVYVERIQFSGGTARAGRNGNPDNSGSYGIDGEDGADGGAMRINDGQVVKMDQVTFNSNFTQSGGNGTAPASSISLIDGGNGGSGGNGGAIYIGTGADVEINRGTFSGNGTGDGGSPASGQSNGDPAEGGRGGNGGNGGAIYSAGSLRLLNCTITANNGGDPTSGAAGVNGGDRGEDGEGGSGGAIALSRYIDGEQVVEGTATLLNNIIAGNTAGDDTSDGTQPGTDFYDNKGGKRFTSEGYNLIGTKNASGAFRTKTGDVIGNGKKGIDPLLNGLNQNDNEAVPTREPRANSPAVNSGTSTMDNNFDARGFLRPADGQADKGAHERESEPFVTEFEISDFNVTDNDGEFVTITNTSNYPAQMDDHVLVAFPRDYDEGGSSCLSSNLYGELAPGKTFTVADPGVESKFHELLLDAVGTNCGSSATDQFDDPRGAIALYKGGAASFQGFVLGNYEVSRKALVEYVGEETSSDSDDSTTSRTLRETSGVEFKAYPNPSSDRVEISFYASQKANYKLRLFDMNGRQLFNKNIKVSKVGDRTEELHLKDYPKGMYIVQIVTPEGKLSKSVVRK